MSVFTRYVYCPNCTTTRTKAWFGAFCHECGFEGECPTFIARPVWGGLFRTKRKGYKLRDGTFVQHGREAIEYEQDALTCGKCGAHLDICEGLHGP